MRWSRKKSNDITFVPREKWIHGRRQEQIKMVETKKNKYSED